MKNKYIIIIILSIIGFTMNSYASGPGTTVANFLKIGIGAKATAMGEAFTAIADDGTSVYWNPAGLAQSKNCELMMMYHSFIEEIQQGYIGITMPISSYNFGFTINYIDIGDIEGRDEFGNPTEDFQASDIHASLACAYRLSNYLLLGVSAGMLQDVIKDDKQIFWLGNAGVLIKTGSYIAIGLSCQNIGSKVGEHLLPLIYRGGIAIKLNPLTVEVDMIKPNDNDMYYCGGLECKVFKIAALRCGYRTEKAENTGSGLSYGAGLKIARIKIDYAYTPMGDLNNSQRFSLAINF